MVFVLKNNRKRLLTGIYSDGKAQAVTLQIQMTPFRIKVAEERLVHLVVVSKCACCAIFNIFITEIL